MDRRRAGVGAIAKRSGAGADGDQRGAGATVRPMSKPTEDGWSVRLYADVPYDFFKTAGDFVFTAGACPLDDSGKMVAPGSFETQAVRAVENLIAVLTAAGSNVDALLKTTIYVELKQSHAQGYDP